LVSGDHSFTSFTSTSIVFRHPKRYPQDSSFCKAEPPRKPPEQPPFNRSITRPNALCNPPERPPVHLRRSPALGTGREHLNCEPANHQYLPFEPRTSEPPIKPPLRHQDHELGNYPFHLHMTTIPGEPPEYVRTPYVRTHPENTSIPTSNLPKPRFSSDFYTELLRFPIYTLLCRRRVFATKRHF
jgi:hypothetical protein